MFSWFSAAGGAVIMALVAYGLHSVSMNMAESRHKADLSAQEIQLKGQCSLAKAITTEVSNGLQIDLGTLDVDGTAIDRMLPCANQPSASLVSIPASGHDATTAGQEPDKRIVRTFEPRRVTAIVKKGERYRVQLKACQSYVHSVEKAAQGR